jgi:hypothetical protein
VENNGETKGRVTARRKTEAQETQLMRGGRNREAKGRGEGGGGKINQIST